MTTAELSSCSCGASFRWGRIAGGKRIPVNPEPDPDRGNLRYIGTNLDGEDVYVRLSEAETQAARKAGADLFLTHFANCPDAARHRRR